MSIEDFKREHNNKLIKDGVRLPFEHEDDALNVTNLGDGGVGFNIKNFGHPGITAEAYIHLSEKETKKLVEFLLFKINN